MDAAAVAARIGAARERIRRAGGDPHAVAMVAVTKGFGTDAVHAACEAGVTDVGENYAQELLAKRAGAPGALRWHFLGPVQRNKVRALAPLVHLWHAVDRPAAGDEIARWARGARVLVQVDVREERGRPGCRWDEAPALVHHLRAVGLDVRGLMAIGAPGDPRPGFRRLAALARELGLPELSMGMSGDLEVAIEEGATIVRLGTALFGPRPVGADLRR